MAKFRGNNYLNSLGKIKTTHIHPKKIDKKQQKGVYDISQVMHKVTCTAQLRNIPLGKSFSIHTFEKGDTVMEIKITVRGTNVARIPPPRRTNHRRTNRRTRLITKVKPIVNTTYTLGLFSSKNGKPANILHKQSMENKTEPVVITPRLTICDNNILKMNTSGPKKDTDNRTIVVECTYIRIPKN